MTDEIVGIDSPCYCCYIDVEGKCYSIDCKLVPNPWSGELKEDYKVEVKKENEMVKQEQGSGGA